MIPCRTCIQRSRGGYRSVCTAVYEDAEHRQSPGCGAQKLCRSRISLRNLGLDTIGVPVFHDAATLSPTEISVESRSMRRIDSLFAVRLVSILLGVIDDLLPVRNRTDQIQNRPRGRESFPQKATGLLPGAKGQAPPID